MPDRAEQAGDEPRPEEHEHGDPVRRSRQHDRAEQRQRDHDQHAARELDAGPHDLVGPPVARHARDRQRDEVDAEHVDDADRARAEEPGEQQRRAADRPNDERLQQAALRICRHDAEREEHGEHDAEEHRREHREADEERAGERARVDVDVLRRRDRRQLAEHVVVREPEEEQEGGRQHEDDGEHLPAHRLAEAVLDDDGDGAQSVSPPTASRYVSSSVEVSTRTP